jgi:beta-mannanase
MKRKLVFIFVIGGLLLIGRFTITHKNLVRNLLGIWESNTLEINSYAKVYAKFSFQNGAFVPIHTPFPHFTVKLTDLTGWKNNNEAISGIADSIPLLVTIEAWGGNVNSRYFNSPTEDLVEGKFDQAIKQMCLQLLGKRSNIFLRFNPEMEVYGTLYPWQRDGELYIESFRHFARLCKMYAPQVKQIWGPAGYTGADELYPGDDVVDAISVTIKSDSKPLEYPTNYPISYDLFRRLHRLRFFDKTVFILGSKQAPEDSINDQLFLSIKQRIDAARTIAYSSANFDHSKVSFGTKKNNKIEIGLYDPNALLIDEKPVTVEHLFVDFGNLSDGTFQNSFNKVVERGHNVIVTFEPFRNPNGENDSLILQHITAGKYESEIKHLYSIISSTDRKVYLRFAHEMEIPVDRYPWQNQDPLDYIKSFRYFMTYFNPVPVNIQRIWGPAGDSGSLEWWPGNDVVDFVSIAIYGLPDADITDHNKQLAFSTIFNNKSWVLRFIDKPIFITEFGVKGPETYQTKWLEDAANVIRGNPQIIGVNYFNMADTPKAWGDIEPPDWKISKKSFEQFMSALNSE